MKKNILSTLILLFGSVGVYATSTDIIIKGNISNIPSKKVYLTDAFRWDVFIDSSDYNGHSFFFRLDSKKFSPFQASIGFKNKAGKFQQLLFAYSNPIIVNNSKITGITSFMLDKGITTLSGDANTSIRLPHNAQNESFEKSQSLQFLLKGLDKQSRIKKLDLIASYIKKYPYSYFLLASIYNYRSFYSKEELKYLLSLFDQDIKQSNQAIAFNKYIFIISCTTCVIPNAVVEDDKKITTKLNYSSSKITMLIFWASWCMPCRKEIPSLKTLHNKYASLGLQMFSISIDTDNSAWKKALQTEKMVWPQYIIPQPRLEDTKSEFNFIAIPTIIFVDNRGTELKRFTGFDERNISEYNNLINTKLKN